MEWRNFFRWYEGKTQFLIYGSPMAFNVIPKRTLTPEQVFELRNLLTQHIGATR